MAEATLCITMVHPGMPIDYEIISQSALSKSSRAIKIDERANDPFKIVCDCGPVVQGTDLRIVDQSGNKLGDGEIGHILVRGPSIAANHHEFAAQSGTVAKDGWLHTGDLGYLRNARLL